MSKRMRPNPRCGVRSSPHSSWAGSSAASDRGCTTAWKRCSILNRRGACVPALGVDDRLGRVAGGGSILPITGFANSVVSPALEFNREGVFFGVCAKMFVIAGPIIVFGVVSGVVVGVIHLFV